MTTRRLIATYATIASVFVASFALLAVLTARREGGTTTMWEKDHGGGGFRRHRNLDDGDGGGGGVEYYYHPLSDANDPDGEVVVDDAASARMRSGGISSDDVPQTTGHPTYLPTEGEKDEVASSSSSSTVVSDHTWPVLGNGGNGNVHHVMGGEVEVGRDAPFGAGELTFVQLYSSTPFRPREYEDTGTAYVHYKNSKEKDGMGSSTFPPTFSPTSFPISNEPTNTPIEQMYGWYEPTLSPSRFPTKIQTSSPTEEEEVEVEDEIVGFGLDDTKEPTREPTRMPTRMPNEEPTKYPTKYPTKLPTKEPTPEPTRLPTRMPNDEPTKEPTKEPTMEPTKKPEELTPKFDLMEGDDDDDEEEEEEKEAPPSDPPAHAPGSLFYCGDSVGDAASCETPCPNGIKDCVSGGFCYSVPECRGQGPGAVGNAVSDSPTDEPTREPISRPDRKPGGYYCGDSVQAAGSCEVPCESTSDCATGFCYNVEECPEVVVADNDDDDDDDGGGFYCGRSVGDASSCERPCPNGIEDCDSGFCYAVPKCAAGGQPAVTNSPITPFLKPTSSDSPSRRPTSFPTPYGGEFHCGSSHVNASDWCEYSCPTGSPTECPDGLNCYASTGCADESREAPTRPPSHDPSSTFYCGTSFQNASASCDVACPSGNSGDCPPGTVCYANTPCKQDKMFYCGTSMVNASASCEHSCSSGLDSDCPPGLTCYGTQTCQDQEEEDEPIGPPKVADGTKYCGTSFQNASETCGVPCPNGMNNECPDGMSCYSSTPCEEKGSFYCGLSWNNAASSCKLPCPSGTDDDCPDGTHCYAYTPCNKTDSFMCGTSFENASSSCDRPCPTGSPTECPSGMSCYTHTTCDADTTKDDMPASSPDINTTSPPYIPGDSYYCGTSFLEASSQCTHPCPTRMDSECPDGEQCYGSTPCPTRKTYYCGANLDEASAICEHPCPSGSSSDCPTGMSCFAFTTCAAKDSFFCGDNFMNASGTCDTPCPSGLSSDCPENLTCFAHTTCDVGAPEPTDSTGDLSAFCGVSFDEATRTCSLPCPTGLNSECPGGMTCHIHTSCQDRDSFMCGRSWEDAAATCSDPCPSGEHSECPNGMKCFAYTPCNNAGSFFCGKSFDEAASCNHPCPSGKSKDCPKGLNCFSYTSCGTGDFNPTKPPVPAPATSATGEFGSFYCGKNYADANKKCATPCPGGTSLECPLEESCIPFTTCSQDEATAEDTQTPAPIAEPASFYCGSSFENATSTCSTPCAGGSSSECPDGQSCYGYTSCSDKDSFYCGKTWEDASSNCSKSCQSNNDCEPEEVCFGYTTCNIQNTDIPVESFYCGKTFEEASMMCEKECPSGKHSDCPDGQLCHPHTPCGERDSFFCGSSWVDASTSCKTPCPSGSSSECPGNQLCFPSTPCDEVQSFFCGSDFDDANDKCGRPCESGRSGDCEKGEGCFAYTLCSESGTNAVPTSPLSPVQKAPPESFYCGASYDDASMMCNVPCPSGKSEQCPDDLLCFASTPCSDRGSFFCGTTWEAAASSCTSPCPSGLSSDCSKGETCYAYTPCSKTETFYCGTTFHDASSTCTDPCPSGKDNACPKGETCHKYTPCNDITPSDVKDQSLLPFPVDSYFCGTNFVDASTKCYLPCPTGGSAECPIGEACYGNTPCSSGDSSFCGKTWYDAASECKDPCPTGLDEECPAGTKCFGYTPCSESNSFYCGVDFLEASTNCSIPCPTGSSAQCPPGLACFPNTPCDMASFSADSADSADMFDTDTYAPTPFTFNILDANVPDTNAPTQMPSLLSSPTGAPHTAMLHYCGSDIDSIDCFFPCPNGDECPLDQECYATQDCSDSFYCGVDFTDANSTCSNQCPDGSDNSCPIGMKCYAQTSCASVTDEMIPNFSDVPSDSYFCGFTDASTNCTIPCPSGKSDTCPIGQSCFAYTTCDVPVVEEPSIPSFTDIPSESYFCGLSYEKASKLCSLPCSDGNDSSCPQGQKCFAFTPCAKPESFFCGEDMEDANAKCAIPCPSGKSNTCPTGQSCFAYTTCEIDAMSSYALSPSTSPITLPVVEEPEDAVIVPNFSEIPSESYFCGLSYEDASGSCSLPCSDGKDSKCPQGQKCFAFTPCAKPESFFCGTDMTDANAKCAIPCPSGKSNKCPTGQSCFAYTTCEIDAMSSYALSPSTSPITMSPIRRPTLNPTTESPTDEPTVPPTTEEPTLSPEEPTLSPTDEPTLKPTPFPTESPTEFPTKYPTKFPTRLPTKKPIIPVVFDVPEGSFYCGVTFNHASKMCGIACPGGDDDCPVGMNCFGNTPCGDKNSFFCGTSYDDANKKCTTQCKTGSANECPSGESCFAYTMCKPDTKAPTDSPSMKPTPYPTKEPTPYPTKEPTPYPTKEPATPYPTKEPSPKPTEKEAESAAAEPAAEESEEEEPEEEESEEEEPEEEEPEEQEQTEEEPEEEEQTEEEPEEEEQTEEKPEEEPEALTIQIKQCDDPLAMTVNQAYWRSWSSDSPETCNKFDASDIDGTSYTHVVYSFASISADGLVEPWVGSFDEVDKYKEFNKVKQRNPKVKTIIAVTEGVFYGSGMNPVTYNEVVASESTRMAFAQSAVSFLELYDFDGIEIDWDAPLDTDKGGSPDNYELFVLLAEEIRRAIEESQKEFIFTIALPPTDWELYDYDVIGLSEHVDWFNLMSFDYHTPKNIPKTVGAHSDLKMIDSVVFELLKETVSTKFVLGMAAFGRTYTLADDRCQELGCPFRSPGLGGCGNTKGFLPFSEIHEYIESGSYDQLHQDVSSSSMIAVVDGDQMISFDDESTWAIKEAYAEMMCLRGTMLWSVDMLKPKPPSQPQQNTVDTGRLLSALESTVQGCDICAETELIEDKIVMYAGNTTTCGDLSVLLHPTKASNFRCSLARSLLTSSCCARTENKDQPPVDTTPPPKPCNICQRNQIHHELKSEQFVEYKGTSVSCLDLNSILAKNEVQDSEMCSDTQSVLFDDCCYEKCSLCGDKSLRYDTTVKFNNQILSCNELGPMLTLGMVRDGSDQCNSVQSAYSNTCCFTPPERRCSLCEHGSVSLEVNSNSFVKTRSSSIHCMNLAKGLADREEDGSPACEESKLEYSTTCCIASSSHKPGSDASYYDWLADHLKQQPSPTPNAANITTISLWSLIVTTLLLAFKR